MMRLWFAVVAALFGYGRPLESFAEDQERIVRERG